jgi:hypothetical protein
MERHVHLVVAGQGGELAQQKARQQFVFDPEYQTVTLHRLAVLRGVEVLDVTRQVTPRFLTTDSLNSSVYMSRTQVVLEVPDVRPSDQVEMVLTLSGSNPVLGTLPTMIDQWELARPVSHRRLVLNGTPGSLVQPRVVPHSNPDLATLPSAVHTQLNGGGERWVWEASNVPAVKVFSQAPPGKLQVNLIQASAHPDWDSVRRLGLDLFNSVPAPQSPAFESLVTEFARLPTPSEQVVAALRWVQSELRYVSLSMGENSHRPHPPDEVLQRRYGDCKDKALLLVHLLRRLGLEVQPALVRLNGGDWPQRALPSPLVFDHAVAVAWLDGQPHVLDGTLGEQPSALERLGTWRARDVLLVLDGPHAGWLTAPGPVDEMNTTFTVDEVMELQPDGQTGRLSIREIAHGTQAERRRWQLAAQPLATVKKQVLDAVRNVYPDTVWRTDPVVMDDKPRNVLTQAGELLVRDPLRRAPGNPWRHRYSIRRLSEHLPTVGGRDRTVGFGLSPNTRHVRLSHTLKLPEGWRTLEEPFDEEVKDATFQIRVRRQMPDAQTVVDTYELDLLADDVPVQALDGYLKAVRQVQDHQPEMRLAQ